LRQAASTPKIFAAFVTTKKTNSKPMNKPNELTNQRQKQKLPLWGWLHNKLKNKKISRQPLQAIEIVKYS